MADEHLASYLNDHLAGSTAALELLENLQGATHDPVFETVVAELRSDIEADRRELETMMDRLGISQSGLRKASGWLAAKVTELKLRLDDVSGGDLRLFESLEALSLGIEGKRGLWIALAAVKEKAPGLQAVEYSRLIKRAEDQRSRVETMRLAAASEALKPGSSPH
jgi:hypothetical protein